jgi:hypothetical protein
MSFFQNPFSIDFFGNWILADRKQALRFPEGKISFRNHGRADDMVVSWHEGPYNLSINDADGNSRQNLELNFAVDADGFKNWATIRIDVSGAVPAATTPSEIVVKLNSDATFSSYFVAESGKFPDGSVRVHIRQKFPVTRMRFYVSNGMAEEELRFNARADVAELPSYFSRHSIASRNDFDDAQNMLVELDVTGWAIEGDTVAGDVVFHAADEHGKILGLDPTAPKLDWEMLRGRSGLFMFRKNCINDDKIVQTIEYQAGAVVGDLARKICYYYNGASQPEQVTEEPYTLTADDLIIPNCENCEGEGPA